MLRGPLPPHVRSSGNRSHPHTDSRSRTLDLHNPSRTVNLLFSYLLHTTHLVVVLSVHSTAASADKGAPTAAVSSPAPAPHPARGARPRPFIGSGTECPRCVVAVIFRGAVPVHLFSCAGEQLHIPEWDTRMCLRECTF